MTELKLPEKNWNIKNIIIRIIGGIGCLAVQYDWIPVSATTYNSFPFVVLECVFLFMLFYKVDVRKWSMKWRILVILLILLEWGLVLYLKSR